MQGLNLGPVPLVRSQIHVPYKMTPFVTTMGPQLPLGVLRFVFSPCDQNNCDSIGAYGWYKDVNTPNWSSMADDPITRGSTGGLESHFYFCE